ncbi:hypothetical protein BH10PLA1_BH10PLA1_10120 [soil metagenome]
MNIDLEEPNFEFKPPDDRRPTIPEPPPVRLVAVEDVSLFATAAHLPALDAFYVGLLKFEREGDDASPVYRAENVRLRFMLVEKRALREDMRPTGVEVPFFSGLEKQLTEMEITFSRELGINAGELTYLLQDPAGNWIRIGQVRRLL